MANDALHTRLVKGGRVILPLAALMLLATLFLLARNVNPDDAIPFAEIDVSERARDRQLTAPRFTGVSQDGTEFALSAARARPDIDDPRLMSAEILDLKLVDPGGGATYVEAATGTVDTATRDIALDGGVRIETSTGFTFGAPRMAGSLQRLDMRATGGVRGDGPLGTIRADAAHLTEDATGAQRLLFTGGVELVYMPADE